MKDKNINTILVLIIILLCYMYFTKKNCKKEIEGFSNDTILRRQTLASASEEDDEDGEKEGEEIVIQSGGSDEKSSQTFISQIIPFFYDNPILKDYEVISKVPEVIPSCKDGPCKVESDETSLVKVCELNKDLPDNIDCKCPEKSTLKNYGDKMRCLPYCEKIKDNRTGEILNYSNLYSLDYPCACEEGELKFKNEETGDIKRMCVPSVECNKDISAREYTSWINDDESCNFCKGEKSGNKIIESKLVRKDFDGIMKKRCEPVCDKEGVELSVDCTCKDGQKLITRGDKKYCLSQCRMDGEYSVDLPDEKEYDCYCPDGTKKEKKDYGNGIKNKCAPYCMGDINKGYTDYVSKDDKCVCPDGLIEVIDNQQRKRCEKECKIVDGKNYTEWLDKGIYCKTPDSFKTDFKHKITRENDDNKNEYRYIHQVKPGMNFDIKEKVWRMPLDMPGQNRTSVQTWQQCSTRCRYTPGCKYFNFFPDGGCHITTGADGEKEFPKNPTKYSGETLGANDVKSDGKSFLPVQDIDLMDKSYKRKSNIEKNWEACRVRCASTKGCINFNYYKDKRCHLTRGTSVGFRTVPEMKWRTIKTGFMGLRKKKVRKPTGNKLNVQTSQRGSGGRDYLLQPDSLYLNKKISFIAKNKIRNYHVPKNMIK